MARASRLKVYRTPIGFHDAYVAAPSQKAALAAWGGGHDLFSTGEAELVTDPALTAEPLTDPGKIVRRVRGSVAEHFAALPREQIPTPSSEHAPPMAPEGLVEPSPQLRKAKPVRSTAKPVRPTRPPKPSHDAVVAARRSLREATANHQEQRRSLLRRERELIRERRELEKAQAGNTKQLTYAVERAEADYRTVMKKWSG